MNKFNQYFRKSVRRVLEHFSSVPLDDPFETHERFVRVVYGTVREKYTTFILSETQLSDLWDAFAQAPRTDAMPRTKGMKYVSSNHPPDVYNSLNRDYIYLDCKDMDRPIQALLNVHSVEIERACGSPFCAVNVRAWETNSEANEFGPSAWHQDGFAPGHLKLMIYLEGLGGDLGSLELEGLGTIEGPSGLVVLFQNSDITHRAVPAKTGGRRPLIEVTLQRVLRRPASFLPQIGDNNDRHLSDPFLAYGVSE